MALTATVEPTLTRELVTIDGLRHVVVRGPQGSLVAFAHRLASGHAYLELSIHRASGGSEWATRRATADYALAWDRGGEAALLDALVQDYAEWLPEGR